MAEQHLRVLSRLLMIELRSKKQKMRTLINENPDPSHKTADAFVRRAEAKHRVEIVQCLVPYYSLEAACCCHCSVVSIIFFDRIFSSPPPPQLSQSASSTPPKLELLNSLHINYWKNYLINTQIETFPSRDGMK